VQRSARLTQQGVVGSILHQSVLEKITRVRGHWRLIAEAQKAVETTKETWCAAEVSRIAGLVALSGSVREATKAEMHFEHSLAVARQQQAKSWELRAAMSMARLWRDQGKAQQARELLAPVYGWFTKGFNTRDLKEEALLEELA
jgi:predicted ATPase